MLLCKIHSHLKRSLIYVRTQRIFIVAKVIKSAFAVFITGKVETLGSTFSNETPIGGCLRPHATMQNPLINKIFQFR